MSAYRRAIHGAEAGTLTAAAIEISFFVLDLVRLQPLATPVALSGAGIGPGDSAVDATGFEAAFAGLWAAAQVATLTFAHFATFALVGLLLSVAFDWSRPMTATRYLTAAVLCTAAFYISVAWSSSMIAMESVEGGLVLGMNLLGAGLLCAVLRLVATPDEQAHPES